jgi:hypothetical protein
MPHRGLRSAVLLRCGIARRAEGDSVKGLPRLEDARDTKVNKIQVMAWSYHDIAGLEIPENNRRGLGMKKLQHGTDLIGEEQHLPYVQTGGAIVTQPLLQSHSVDIVHHQVPAPA